MKNKLDTTETLELHRQIILKRKPLYRIYLNFYHRLGVSKLKGKVLELGSGAGFIKKIHSHVITSDVVTGKDIDMVFFAEKIPFKKNTLSGIVMIDTLHHIKNSEKALKEMERCLKIGGKIIMIEPYNSWFGRFIYQHFHDESFDPKGTWKIKGKGRLSDANGALPWIIFVRDRKKFERKFSHLRIVKIEPHTPFLYLYGGLSKPQLIPTFLFGTISFLERLVKPFNHILAMFVTIELEKVE